MGGPQERPQGVRGAEGVAAAAPRGHLGGAVRGGAADGRAGRPRRAGPGPQAAHHRARCFRVQAIGPARTRLQLACAEQAVGRGYHVCGYLHRGLCTPRLSQISIRAPSSAGRSRTTCALIWRSTPWRWRSSPARTGSARTWSTIPAGAQYTSIHYTQRLEDIKAVRSVGSKGDSYDNAVAESVNSLYKKELINFAGPWQGAGDVTVATAEWVHW
jgi:hypothetical protein